MNDPVKLLAALRRPSLLIRAARFGLSDYRRERDLRRLTQSSNLPTPSRALGLLISEEGRMEETRQTGDATYSAARHIELLIALMAEARLMPQDAMA
jgi:Family of unknown function (DUF6477)